VVRETTADRRAYIVKLTKEGRRVFREWAEEHEGCGYALRRPRRREKDQFYALLAELKQHVIGLHPEG
jgi:DNA-binding MarR family transcriptional regulator